MSLDLTILIESGQFVCLREYPGYGVSKNGLVWSCRKLGPTGRIGFTWSRLKSTPQPHGHLMVSLRRDGKTYYRQVHRLVAEAFLGPCPPGLECCHFDDNPANNDLDNLRWDTSRSNHDDAKRNGRVKLGSNRRNSKLHEDDIPIIREMRRQGAELSVIAARFNVSVTTISVLLSGKIWTHA